MLMTGDHPPLLEQKSGLQPPTHPYSLGSSGNTAVLAHFPPPEQPHLSLSSSRQSTILLRSLTVFRYDSSSSFSCSFSLGVFSSSAQDKGSPSHSYRQCLHPNFTILTLRGTSYTASPSRGGLDATGSLPRDTHSAVPAVPSDLKDISGQAHKVEAPSRTPSPYLACS